MLRRRGMREAISSVGKATQSQRPKTAHPTTSAANILTSTRNLPFRTAKQNRKTLGKMTENIPQKDFSEATENEAPKVRKPRIKSAPGKMQKQRIQHQQQQQIKDTTCTVHHKNHEACGCTPPFVMRREVPFEELRPITVEYVAVNTGKYLSQDARNQEKNVLQQMALANHPDGRADSNMFPTAPCSSLNNSMEDLSKISLSQPSPSRNTSAWGPSTVYQWKLASSNQQSAVADKSVTWGDGNSDTATSLINSNNANNTNKQDTSHNKTKMSRETIMKVYTKPQQKTLRAQSAKYYRSSYHQKAAEERYYQVMPRPR